MNANAVIPHTLKKGDRVGIISSARKITTQEIRPAKLLLESWGLEVVIGDTIGKQDNQFAGSDEQRWRDLQNMLCDVSIKAVFFARGGYGSVRILDKTDWNSLLQNPKWLIGYSDVTAVLMHAYYTVGVCGIHGIMPVNIQDTCDNAGVASLKNILFYGTNRIKMPYHTLNVCGKTAGILIGGNLSVMYSLLASNSFKDTDGAVLFIEDLDEYLYHTDRMMQALKRSGKLKNLKALLVGQMSDMHDNNVAFGKTAYEIISDSVKEYGIPVAFNLPVGHIGTENRAFIHGKRVNVDINSEYTLLEQ